MRKNYDFFALVARIHNFYYLLHFGALIFHVLIIESRKEENIFHSQFLSTVRALLLYVDYSFDAIFTKLMETNSQNRRLKLVTAYNAKLILGRVYFSELISELIASFEIGNFFRGMFVESM